MDFKVDYIDQFLSEEESAELFAEFDGYNFIRPFFSIFGKTCRPRREMIAFGNPGLIYSFSGASFEAYPWTETLRRLKERVEKAIGSQFNFVLLNRYKDGKSRINAHKDDEKSLEPSSPIACISLGATREIVFKRRNYPEKKITLRDGSLYTMLSPTNKFWTHEIGPSETELCRISLTFRNILPSTSLGKRKQDDPSYSATPEDIFNSAATNDFFKKLCIETQPNPCITPQNTTDIEHSFPPNRTIFKKSLSADWTISVELFRGNILIHIRKYFMDSKNVLKPSKQGLTFSREEWFEARGKLFNFSLCYPQTSFIVNNAILFLSKDECLEISKLFTSQIVQLGSHALDLLKNVCNDLNEALIDFLFVEHLKGLILSYREGSSSNEIIPTLSSEEEDRLFLQLIKCIENELAPRFFLLYPCNGCIIQHGSQLQHSCMTTHNREKLNFLGDEVLILCNINDIVDEFMKSNHFISMHFLDTLDVKKITEMLFV